MIPYMKCSIKPFSWTKPKNGDFRHTPVTRSIYNRFELSFRFMKANQWRYVGLGTLCVSLFHHQS